MKRIFNRSFFIRLLRWEYWPFAAVYSPIYIYWFWLSFKARSFFFFNTSNPAIRNGGFLMESKKEIYDLMPAGFYPVTLLFPVNVSADEVINKLQQTELKYPLIAKPDIGLKSLLVKKLENENDLEEYVENSKLDFLIQDYVPYENEVGIFYYRYPTQEKGIITGIVKKEFLAITGDGVSSIEQLINKNDRAFLQLKRLRKIHSEKMNIVLEKEEDFVLVPYGSHFRGAKFTDESHLIDSVLTDTINKICKQVNGFYYGRLDIRFQSWEELKQGKKFSIIEINGAGSEPTHIYDPRHSIFFAWKEIIRHWKILYKISKENHQQQNLPYMSTAEGLEMFRQDKIHQRILLEE